MKPHRSVLLVEDGPGDAKLIRELLSEADDVIFDIHVVDRVATAVEYLGRHRNVDVVLLDLGLPDSQGLDTFRSVRAAAAWVPVVVLSGFGDKQTGSIAVAEGAQDYLVKGQVDGELIARAIRYAIERHQRSAGDPGGVGAPAGRVAEATLVTGLDGTVRLATPALREILGTDPDQVIGTKFFALLHPDDLGAATAAFQTRRLRDHRCRLRRRDGSWCGVEASATPLADGTAPTVVLTIRTSGPGDPALAPKVDAR
jgi:PAS domain S-box-containing protein